MSILDVVSGATSLSNLLLVSPQLTVGYQPQNPPNPDGSKSAAALPDALLFHYEGEQTSSLHSDITDHFIEDNTAIQDQIALRPEEITTQGFIGELNDVAPVGLQTAQAIANRLNMISAYTPNLSATALLAYQEAFSAYQTAINIRNNAVATWSSINKTGGTNVIGSSGFIGQNQKNQTQQQIAYQQFYGYWRIKALFTVQTPWAIFQNMAIKDLRAIQDADNNEISTFEVTFKMMRFASTIVNNTGAFSGRASAQAGGVTDNGTSSPVLAPTPPGASAAGITTVVG